MRDSVHAGSVQPDPAMTAEEDPSMLGWSVTVAGYRFFVDASQAPRLEMDPVLAPMHHLPPWVAGLLLADDRLLGVLDLGRLLGVAKAQASCILLPSRELKPAWGLRVHAAAPVFGPLRELPEAHAVPETGETAGLGAQVSGAGVLASRLRPPFCLGRVGWMGPEGLGLEADRLCLRRLFEHPRLRDLQS